MTTYLRIDQLQLGQAVAVTPRFAQKYSLCAFTTVTKVGKREVALADGSKWSVARNQCMEHADSNYRPYLLTQEEGNEWNAAVEAAKIKRVKIARIDGFKIHEHLPDAVLDEIIAVLDRYRQQQADAAEGAYQETGHAY